MNNNKRLSNSLKEAMEKFNKGINDIKPIIDILDPIVKYCEVMDKKLNPLYEKFKRVSEVLDKFDLISETMLRVNKYQSKTQRPSNDPYFNIFQ